MKGWKELEVVETIYEEDFEDCSSSSNSPCSSPSIIPPALSPSSPLQAIVKAWSIRNGLEVDTSIHVQDQCFKLHKGPLISQSGYLRRHLTNETTELTLSPPFTITVETFSSVATFCYCSEIVITPFNVAALRIAAELLEMKAESDGDANLKQKTEMFFRQAVSVNREYATIVLRSCLCLLPEAEHTASLASRCIEALHSVDGVGEFDGWIDDVMSLSAKEFLIVAESMSRRFSSDHDLLYKMVDLYLKAERIGHNKITEDQKTQLCNLVDCEKLSLNLLTDAVQNARMPLRFIVRAMFLEQLNTRRSIISMSHIRTSTQHHHNHKARHNNQQYHHDHQYRHRHHRHRDEPHYDHQDAAAITLGAILQRDAALRQVAELKDLMNRTSSKIESLESELVGMKKQLRESREKKEEKVKMGKMRSSDRRSASFRFSSEEEKKIRASLRSLEDHHGDLGSSASFRFSTDHRSKDDDNDHNNEIFMGGGGVDNNGSSSSSSNSFCSSSSRNLRDGNDDSRREQMKMSSDMFGWKLVMKGLRSALNRKAKLEGSAASCDQRSTSTTEVTSRSAINGDGDASTDNHEVGAKDNSQLKIPHRKTNLLN